MDGLTTVTDCFAFALFTSVVESDGVAPSFMSSCFDLPKSDLDLPKAACVSAFFFYTSQPSGKTDTDCCVWRRYKSSYSRPHWRRIPARLRVCIWRILNSSRYNDKALKRTNHNTPLRLDWRSTWRYAPPTRNLWLWSISCTSWRSSLAFALPNQWNRLAGWRCFSTPMGSKRALIWGSWNTRVT